MRDVLLLKALFLANFNQFSLFSEAVSTFFLAQIYQGLKSRIVKDLNDSRDPKHTLFCRENAFVAIYALFFRQQMSAF